MKAIDMIVFLCSPGDISARWFVASLRHDHGIAAQIITPQELVYAPDMEHRLDGIDTFSSVALKSHGMLDSSSITGVVNRLEFLPDAHLARVSVTDRAYIQQELLAIWSSWISALPCPVINRPTAISVTGPLFHPAIWHQHAAAAGLPTAPMLYDVDLPDPVPPVPVHSVIVCRDQCHSPTVHPDLFGACCDLARYVGFDMLEVMFGQGPEGAVFSLASPVPDLSRAEPGLLAQVAQIFQEGAP